MFNINGSIVLSHIDPTDTLSCYPSFSVRVFLSFLLGVAMLVSLSGNLLICGIVYRRAAMRSGINLLLASYAMTDVLNALINMPFTLIALNMTSWIFGDFLCIFNGLWFCMINGEKIIILLIISIDRYFIIVRRKDTMTPVRAKSLILASWFVSLLVSLPPVFGWGSFVFRCGYVQCLLDFNDQGASTSSYVLFICFLIIIVPTVLLAVIYHRILRTVRRNSFRVQNHPPIAPTAMHKKGRLFIDYIYKTRTSTTILMLTLAHVFTILPYGIASMYLVNSGFNMNFTPCKYIVVLWIVYLHGYLNPLIYYFRITKFRECVRDLWPQYWTHVNLIPMHSRRRIRPHVLYQVEHRDSIFVMNTISP